MQRLSLRRRTGNGADDLGMGRYGDSPDHGRDARGPDIDQWRVTPFDMPPAPERGAVERRVEQLTRSLDGAIDEGNGKSLDLLITSWTGTWIATVESEYHQHCREISRKRGQATEWLTEATVTAQHEQLKLEHLRADYAASRRRLTGERPVPAPAVQPAGVGRLRKVENGGDNAGPAAAATLPVTAQRQDWSEPHLVAGHGWAILTVGAILIVLGALADIIAFHNVLELVLTTESSQVALLMAVGATSLALVVAATVGMTRAVRRRGRYLAPRHRPGLLPVVASTLVWLGMGLAMFVIRWRDTGASGGAPWEGSSSNIWQALFFLGIYLISGVCTMFEAERLYNPEHMAYRRLGKACNKQAKIVARQEARRDRAQAAVDRLEDDLRREDDQKAAAISERKALGAAAANYARVLMAAMMRDPAKTAITETGPLPNLSVPLGAAPGTVTGP